MSPIVVSPGVYTTERDFSLYVPALSTSIFGIVTTASKGPINERTLITDEASLVATFGNPSVDHQGLYAAQRYLREGRQLIVVRVGTYYQTASDLTVHNAAATVDTLTISIPDDAGPGTWANSISVVIAAGSIQGYRLTIMDGVYTVGVYDNLLLGTANESDANFIETRINGVSDYIAVEQIAMAQTTLEAGTFSFSGGLNGAPADDSDIIGLVNTPPTIPSTGLQLFRNPEYVDVNLLAVPGYPWRTVIAELLSICEVRGDCMCLLEVPADKTVQEAVDWHNGTGGGATDPTAALNSSYGALYYPWVTVYDSLADAEVEISPVGHAAQVIARTDYNTETWYAPAGLNRGMLRDVLSIEHSATQGERDYMYGPGNAVNPIVNFSGIGIAIWGQRTLQRAPTALDRINVRRLLLYMRKVIATSVNYLLFEPNDEATWQRFVDLVEPVCRSIMARRGVTGFQVICDETTNTAATIARNEMHGKILIQPTRTAEMIVCEFVLLPSGASFAEFVA